MSAHEARGTAHSKLEIRIQINALLAHGGPVRRQRVIARLVPVVEDLMDDLGDVLGALIGERRGCGRDLRLGQGDAGMLEEDGFKEEQSRYHASNKCRQDNCPDDDAYLERSTHLAGVCACVCACGDKLEGEAEEERWKSRARFDRGYLT